MFIFFLIFLIFFFVNKKECFIFDCYSLYCISPKIYFFYNVYIVDNDRPHFHTPRVRIFCTGKCRCIDMFHFLFSFCFLSILHLPPQNRTKRRRDFVFSFLKQLFVKFMSDVNDIRYKSIFYLHTFLHRHLLVTLLRFLFTPHVLFLAVLFFRLIRLGILSYIIMIEILIQFFSNFCQNIFIQNRIK